MKNYKLRGTLEPLENKSRRFYFEDPKMSASEKKRLANQVLANDRVEKTRQELLEFLENWDYEKYPKITQANLIKVSGRDRKTIQNHYRMVRNRFENK